MRVLVIETATTACSVALLDASGNAAAADSASVGRGHAERLIPMIAGLPDGGRADSIWVDCGPGSFTGIRVGIAAARALGLAWGIPVRGFASLALVATQWFADHAGADAVTVVMEGGHGEAFVQRFGRSPFGAVSPLESIERARAIALPGPVAGNLTGDALVPTAHRAGLLPGADLPARPIYGRAPDAKPMSA